MLYQSFKLLNDTEVNSIQQLVYGSNKWFDGNKSATYDKDLHKRNVQLNGCDSNGAANLVEDRILDNGLVRATIFPKQIFKTFFSRSGVNMFYKKHVDTMIGKGVRRDFSFTLFLGNPEKYEGGELILYIPPETKAIKLNAGEIIIYPTKYLHEVKNVTNGERLVCVGWIESHIQNSEHREILAAIQTSILKICKCSNEGNPTNQEDILALQLAKERLMKELSR